MRIRIKPFIVSTTDWAKTTLLTFFLIYTAIGIATITFLFNLIAGGTASNVTFSMNYFSTFMIFIFINGIIMGASRHSYDAWLSAGMTRKEIILGYFLQFAMMAVFIIIAHLIMTYGFAFLQSAMFGKTLNTVLRNEYFFTMSKLSPITYLFAAFFMSISTTAIGFLIGNLFARWKKIVLIVMLLFGVLFFVSIANLTKDPTGTIQLLETVFKPLDMFFRYYGGDHNAITVGMNNLVISLVTIVLGYIMTIKRIARIN